MGDKAGETATAAAYWQPTVDAGNRQYITGEDHRHGGFMPDDTYGLALDTLVVACADGVIICEGEWLLGKRAVQPQPDWWVIGGRIRAGELIEVALQRNLKRELGGLEFDTSRLQQILGFYNLIWDRRAQAPAENGCHMFSITSVVEITRAERDQIALNNEYVDSAWVTPAEVVAAGNFYHPAVVQMARDAIEYYSWRPEGL